MKLAGSMRNLFGNKTSLQLHGPYQKYLKPFYWFFLEGCTLYQYQCLMAYEFHLFLRPSFILSLWFTITKHNLVVGSFTALDGTINLGVVSWPYIDNIEKILTGIVGKLRQTFVVAFSLLVWKDPVKSNQNCLLANSVPKRTWIRAK